MILGGHFICINLILKGLPFTLRSVPVWVVNYLVILVRGREMRQKKVFSKVLSLVTRRVARSN